jgi:hypothetical protein
MLFEGFFVPFAMEVRAVGDFLVYEVELSFAIISSAFSDSFEATLYAIKVNKNLSYSAS